MKPEPISHGYHANVQELSARERARFPLADLVRVSNTTDAAWAVRNFHRLRLARLIAPGRFIDVVGATREELPRREADELAKYPQEYRTKLFSKRAAVSDDHLVFSGHLPHDKKSICSCDACRRHRVFHGTLDLEFAAHEEYARLSPMGIDVPWYDPSDYCLTEAGLVFFEIDRLHFSKIADTIASDSFPDERRAEALAVFERIKELTVQSRNGMMFCDEGGVEMKPM